MLVIVTTHPIQYQVPIWQALAQDGRVPFEVWYLTDFGVEPSHDREFGATFRWDIDTVSGYPYRFLRGAEGATPIDFWKCRALDNLGKLISDAGAKAVWIQGWQVFGYWQAAWAARSAGAALWLRAESNDLAVTPVWKNIVKRPVLSCLFTRIDRFFCIGAANRRLYQSYGVPESRLVAAPYVVDNERFSQQAQALRNRRTNIRRAWGIQDDAFCILFCGKFVAKKHPADLVRAVQMLQTDGRLSDAHLLFAGAGELGDALRAQCNVIFDRERAVFVSNNAAPNMPAASFTGFLNQTEISCAYVAADCLVLPSDEGETWGLVVNEALASGLPCIVSNACGCAEDLIDEAWRFPVGNVLRLGEALERLARLRPNVSGRVLPTVDDSVAAAVESYLDVDRSACDAEDRRNQSHAVIGVEATPSSPRR